MQVQFSKYHALGNDFLVISPRKPWSRRQAGRLAMLLCDRRTGVGADGILVLSSSRRGDRKVDVFNADGSWAEKSGNGLRIVAVHLHRARAKSREFLLEIGGRLDKVSILGRTKPRYNVRANLGRPAFETREIPMRGKTPYFINRPMRIGSDTVQMTCLAVGNPHAVIPVDNFDFDWKTLGARIEHAPAFPERTNVEFVRVLGRTHIKVAEWERGAGATGSSGTGAAAAVCACAMLGLVDRECEVQFEPGSMFIHWEDKTDTVLLTGPVEYVMSGVFESR